MKIEPCADPEKDDMAFGLQFVAEATNALAMIQKGLSRLERIGLRGIGIDSRWNDEENATKIDAQLRLWGTISLQGKAVVEDDGREYDFTAVLEDGWQK